MEPSRALQRRGLLVLLLVLVLLPGPGLRAAQRALQPRGSCLELCTGDWDCDVGERCVSNGCGHICLPATDGGDPR
ncbi:protein Wfdc21-like [Tachyglossus aculeatus]|uniref:protein Wfdc21-like n=1 Tax=Tachyglossus aculeatus TaxID=9261 RepID=UPI0018F42E6D|nr:protein Wfdc21-like [Tachyglossus aculeatus]